MEAETKVWGETTELFCNNTTSTHYLEIVAGGYCSEHRHMQKTNLFYVITGQLEIMEWDDAGNIVGRIVLRCGESYTVGIGRWHRFKAIIPVTCIEIYAYKYDGVDIERRTQGGLEDN